MFAGSHRPGPVVALWLLPIILGCGKSPAGAGAAKSAAAAPIKTPEDVSLPAGEYLRLGLPAWDREWSAADMTRAAEILAPEAPKIPPPLPRFESKRSGEVFARLVSQSAFARSNDHSVPLDMRLRDGKDFFGAGARIHLQYLSAFGKEVGGVEIVEIEANQLRSHSTLFCDAEAILSTLDKNGRAYTTGMQGLELMRVGLRAAIEGALLTLSERRLYRAEDRTLLAVHVRNTLPALLPRLTPTSRTEMLMRLDRMDDDPDFADLQPALGILRKKAHAAVAAAPAKP